MNLSLPPDGFPERLRLVLGKKSARAFAAVCGLSSAAMHQYLSGKTEPSRPALVAIATHAGVDLNWLVMGVGPMPSTVPVRAGAALVYRDIYDEIILKVDACATRRSLVIPREKLPKVYHYLYERSGQDHHLSEDALLEIVDLIGECP